MSKEQEYTKGAHYVFGTADGATFALHAAITLTAIHKSLPMNL